MKYDPIMCMMVPEKVTTKDSAVNEYEIHYTVPGKRDVMVGSGKGSTEAEAKADFMKYHKSENPKITSVKFYKKVSDESALDKAIKSCDTPNIKESLKQDIKSGKITIKQAGREMYEAGMFNWIPDENEVKRKLGL